MTDFTTSQQQTVARLKRELAVEKIKTRKRDARRKIELGGLVIKSKMHVYSKEIVLGALLDAEEQIKKDASVKNHFAEKGHRAFSP